MSEAQRRLPEFNDPRVQQVYEILCDDLTPPPTDAEHWEGFVARRIVAALSATALEAVGVEPVAHQWRKKGQPWTLEKTFNSEVFATTDDSEVRALYGPDVALRLSEALEEVERLRAQLAKVRTACRSIQLSGPDAEVLLAHLKELRHG